MLKLAAFQVDCTPPTGICMGFGTPDEGKAEGVRDPLWLRGFVLDDGRTRVAIASLDYCGLMNRAYDEMTAALVKAVRTRQDRVVVHCIHQHDAPLIDFELGALLGCETYPAEWWRGLLGRVAESARAALASATTIADVGHAETRLHGYASNRRIIGANGKLVATRWSRCADAAVRDLPVGTIDPMLRTVAFRDRRGRVAAALNFYATHPQTANGRHRWSADAPGEAMRLIEEKHPGLVPAFFTGAGGNVTAGKYSSPTDPEGNLKGFGALLAAGVAHNLSAMTWEAARNLGWTVQGLPFPQRRVSAARLLADIKDLKSTAGFRLQQGVVLSAMAYAGNAEYPLRLLRLGSLRALFLGGEPFVEYQLHAQSLVPDEFVALAANCSDNFLYLPLARSFGEGGYEPTSYCWCSRDIEKRLKQGLATIMGAA